MITLSATAQLPAQPAAPNVTVLPQGPTTGTSGQVHVQWDLPDLHGIPLVHCVLMLREVPGTGTGAQERHQRGGHKHQEAEGPSSTEDGEWRLLYTTGTNLTVSGFLPSTQYHAAVMAVSLLGPSPASPVTLFRLPDPPRCKDDCSGHGECVYGLCHCAKGRLGAYCETAATFRSRIMQGSGAGAAEQWLDAHWRFDDQRIYIQLDAALIGGWFSLIIGHDEDGAMGHADVWHFYVPRDRSPDSAVTATDRFVKRYEAPGDAEQQDLHNVHGFRPSPDSQRVYFERKLITDDPLGENADHAIVSGPMRCAWAFSQEQPFSKHAFKNRGKFVLDWLQSAVVGVPYPPAIREPIATAGTNTSLLVHWLAPTKQSADPLLYFSLYISTNASACAHAHAQAPSPGMQHSGSGGGGHADLPAHSHRHAHSSSGPSLGPPFDGFFPVTGCSGPEWTPPRFSCEVEGLHPDTCYDFYVTASNVQGESHPSDRFRLRTLASFPLPPLSVQAPVLLRNTSSTLTLGWTKPEVFFARVVNWTLLYRPAHDHEWQAVPLGYLDSVTKQFEYTLGGLRASTSYQLRVDLLTIGGASQGAVATHRTAEGDPCPNGCSGQGQCVHAVCRCKRGFIANDCSVGPVASAKVSDQSSLQVWVMVVQDTHSHSHGHGHGHEHSGSNSVPSSSASASASGVLHVQLQWEGAGYAALLLEPEVGGMTRGDCWAAFISSKGPQAEDRWSTGTTKPDDQEPQDLHGVSGYFEDGHSVVTFWRKLDTGDAKDRVIQRGQRHISWATGSTASLTQHSPEPHSRGRAMIDFFTGSVEAVAPRDDWLPDLALAGGLLLCVAAASLVVLSPALGTASSGLGHCCLRRKVGIQRRETALDRLTLSARNKLSDLSWGELALLLAYAAAVTVYALSKQYEGSAGRQLAFAYLTGVHLSLALLPVARNSVWTFLLGISFERAVKYHRWAARVTLVFATTHGVTMFLARERDWSAVLAVGATEHGYGVVYGPLAWLCMAAMALLSLEPVRRRLFELFYYAHLLLFPCTLVLVLLHATLLLRYLALPLALYLADRVIRFVRSHRPVEVVRADVLYGQQFAVPEDEASHPAVTRLELYLPNFTFRAGDYCFLRVPAISATEWHPFSVSCGPFTKESDNLTFHVLDMGQGTWTRALQRHSDALASGRIPIWLDGPYGAPSVPVARYPVVVLCAGGIGITPLISMLADLMHKYHLGRLPLLRSVHVVWASRTAFPVLTWFAETLEAAHRTGDPFHLHLYVTQDDPVRARAAHKDGRLVFSPSSGGSARDLEMPLMSEAAPETPLVAPRFLSPDVDLHRGRPDYEALFHNIYHQAVEPVAVMACGPSEMVAAVQNAALRRDFHFHKETFAL